MTTVDIEQFQWERLMEVLWSIHSRLESMDDRDAKVILGMSAAAKPEPQPSDEFFRGVEHGRATRTCSHVDETAAPLDIFNQALATLGLDGDLLEACRFRMADIDHLRAKLTKQTEAGVAIASERDQAKRLLRDSMDMLEARQIEEAGIRRLLEPLAESVGVTQSKDHGMGFLVKEVAQAVHTRIVWQAPPIAQNKDERLRGLVTELLENLNIPDRNCSCHISPPCSDCTEWAGLREMETAVRAHLEKNP